ncbi:MAG: prenyltransferase/squalene oxidase repeat-containing protein, partial [Candidatus Acidiferrales bacterium]
MTPEAQLRFEVPTEGGTKGTATVRRRNVEFQFEQAIARSTEWLLSAQNQEGYWWGELEADTTRESDYILYLHILGELDSPKVSKLAHYIRRKQLPAGGWNIFEGGPSEVNATIKAYVALRLAGEPASAPSLVRAKEKILELGGLEATNSYVRFYL